MNSIFYNKLLMQRADYILVHEKKKIYIDWISDLT